jgi:hypothetical protein
MNYNTTETLQKYYDQVFQDGKLVNLSIAMWSMSHRLSEDDLKLNDQLPDIIKLGKKMLIKPSVYACFSNLQSRARNYLYANSFSFPLVPQAHFVPKRKYLEVNNKLNAFRAEFLELKNEFLANYEAHKEHAVEYYKGFSEQLNIESIAALYPNAKEVAQKFSFEIVSFEITLPTEFSSVDIHTEVAREQAAAEAKKESQEEFQVEYQNQLQTHMSKINSFVSEVIDTLRSKIVEHCTLVLNKIKKKDVVTDSSIKTLMGHIGEFRSLNFVDDKVIEAELAKVEKLLVGGGDFSKDKNAVKELQACLSSVIDEAKNISDVANISGEYFRKLEV